MGNIGYRGDFVYPADTIGDFIELHIEQGPVLDAENISIGIVESLNGMAWLKSEIFGSENHAGTTPMLIRQDALAAAADAVLFLNRRSRELAREKDASVVGTTGRLVVQPNNTNIIPGRVELGQDIRAATLGHIHNLIAEATAFMKGLADRYGVRVEVNKPEIQQPLQLSAEIAGTIESAANQVGAPFKRMHSGALHDAQNMVALARTGMVFVPSVSGISHAPLEWTHWEDVENGVSVLTETVKLLA